MFQSLACVIAALGEPSIMELAKDCVKSYEEGNRPMDSDNRGHAIYHSSPSQQDYDYLESQLGRSPSNDELARFEDYFADFMEILEENNRE